MSDTWLLRVTVPFDAARRSAFRATVRHPRLSALLTRRDARLSVVASVQAIAAFLLAVWCPVLLLVLGPVVLGVAHVTADVRHLVLKRKLPSRVQHLVWLGCASLIALRVLGESHWLPIGLDRAEWALATSWVAVSALVGAASARSLRRAVVATALIGAAGAAALVHPEGARLLFAQAHNLVALWLWLYLFRENRRAAALPLALVVLGTAWLLSGQLYAVTLHHGQATAFGVHVFEAADWFAPGLRGDLAIGLTSAFAFLQSVHYAVWLLYVPQDDQRFETTRSFRASARSFVQDLGRGWAVVVASAAVLVVVLALANAVRTRHLYLSLAMFHGYLELAMLAYFWTRGAPISNRAR